MKRLRTLCKHLEPVTCDSNARKPLPLAGVRVVELSSVMAAPLCGALLADYGAEVIKIEDPKTPDVTRGWGGGDDPAKTADPALHATVEGGGSSFVQLNRGKKSIALDPTKPEGKKIFKQLLTTADIFITNVRIKSLQKAGLDYESLASEFPKLIYGHLTAFGRAGEMANDPGYDFGAFWAQTGLMDIVRSSDDAPMPREPGGIGDYTTGMHLLGGIFTALYHREKTGEGQLVDASLMRSGVWCMGQPLMSLSGGATWTTTETYNWGIRGPTTLGKRNQFSTKAPFRCKDGVWVQLLGNDVGRHLMKMPALLGVTAETLFPDLKNIDWAAANRVADAVFATRTFKEWEPLMKKHDVWYKPVNKFEDQLDPSSPAYQQSKAVGSYVDSPGISRHELLATPVHLSAMPAVPQAPAPKFGEHTLEVLQEIGVSAKDVEGLKKAGIVGASKGLRAQRKKKKP